MDSRNFVAFHDQLSKHTLSTTARLRTKCSSASEDRSCINKTGTELDASGRQLNWTEFIFKDHKG